MKMQTVIFDLDGTLLNTLEDLTDSVNLALQAQGFPPRTLEEVRSFVGNGVKKLISRAVPQGTSPEVVERCFESFRNYYGQGMENKTKPYDGILPLLESLKNQEISMAVVSNKYDPAVKHLCQKYFPGLIQVAIGESEETPKKPAPDGIYAALSQLNRPIETAFYVGDSEVDVETAKNAGMKCIAVTWGFRDRKTLEKAGADIILDRPEDILLHL